MRTKRTAPQHRSLWPVDDTPEDRTPADTAPHRTTLPLFPLDTALLPGAHLPLHIMEPRYRQLTVDLMNATEEQRIFGIVTSKTPVGVEIINDEQVHTIGCAAQLREVRQHTENGFDTISTGRRRFRLLQIDPAAAPYLIGTVEWIDDDPVTEHANSVTTALAELAREAHRRYCNTAWQTEWNPPPTDTDLGTLAYTLAADCLLSHDDRQRLLAETHPVRRLRMARDFLSRETGLLERLSAIPAPPSALLNVQDQAHPN